MRRKSPSPRIATATIVAVALAAFPVGSIDAHDKEDDPKSDGTKAEVADGSLYSVVDQIGARELWTQGITGHGVNVAVIDTGVSPVPALAGEGKLIASVDLSNEYGDPDARHLDSYGHGTHIAGIIAGNDPAGDPSTAADNPDQFFGVAPDAGIVSVKVGGRDGNTSILQVVAGVDWVVDHADELDIDIINLSYSSGSPLEYELDPLTFALERAWQSGIVVVTSAGNDGKKTDQLASPAIDPYLVAVGGAEFDEKKDDFKVPKWATKGDEDRVPDVAAPGVSIESLRVPGSFVDLNNPGGFVNDQLFRGSGSSQSAAVVSGAAALLLDDRPGLSPDQVKELLMTDTTKTGTKEDDFLGNGVIQLAGLPGVAVSGAVQQWTVATGLWSIADFVIDETDKKNEEQNAALASSDVEWLGAQWSGARWSGGQWSDAQWSGAQWSGAQWSGGEWMGAQWSGAQWSGAQWSGEEWSGARWSGARWSEASWS
ncbi:MAG: S8 family serine peptidase [Ilumatobacter sp.]